MRAGEASLMTVLSLLADAELPNAFECWRDQERCDWVACPGLSRGLLVWVPIHAQLSALSASGHQFAGEGTHV